MIPEQKDLLVKDLCARLPYGVKLHCISYTMTCIGPYTLNTIVLDRFCNEDTKYVPFDEVKPYLFPLSSMTEEQRVEAFALLNNCDYYTIDNTIKWLDNHPIKFFDWCNKNHFDYRNLIDKNLAIDCTNLNIY